ncbi:hypothetical protein PAXINDRAFT_22291 [Paxillus involutus ATCC 200175]|uniref:Uncharacterized protein n=1 Tax=Paxillus involutus ATCC 200175 TaxID=664439 RepID=A0A0C9TAW0_PAXIN|nr:hypothetical protein PAXINDRAFT_22291 [Paxillus involutus ATCC 200175]
MCPLALLAWRSSCLGLDVSVVDIVILAIFVDCFPTPSIPRLYSSLAPFNVIVSSSSMCLGMRYLAISTSLVGQPS